MTVSSCPKCYDKITVPGGAAPSSRVQCPLCGEEYLLEKVLDKLPPALILLDASAEPAESFGGGIAVATDSPSESEEGYAVAEPAEETPTPAFQFDQESAPQVSSSPSFTATPRSRPRQKSPVVEIVKIVGGGVAGIVIAQLILWWLPQSVRRDPANLGPKVSRVVPWIVPTEFRGNNKSASDTDKKTKKTKPRSGKSYFDELSNEPTPNKQSTTTNGNTNVSPAAPKTDELTIDEPKPVEPKPTPKTKSPTDIPFPLLDNKPKVSPPKNSTPKDPISFQTEGVRNLKQSTLSEFNTALVVADTAKTAWDEAESSRDENDEKISEQFKQAARELYSSLARLGEVTLTIDRVDEAVRNKVPELYRLTGQLSEKPATMNMLASAAASWLANDERSNRGVLLVGTVDGEVEMEGELYVTRIKLLGRDETHAVYGWVKPGPDLKTSAQVILIGATINDPEKNLIGYEGGSPQVICGSFYRVLPGKSPDESADN